MVAHLPTVLIAGAAGVWLFYVQHQYEDAYFHEHQDWDYAEAALDGSSHYRLPKVLEWFSANIGYHHLHHLDSKIPNYSLAEVEKRHPNLQAGSEITLLDSLRCWSLKLWDEDQGKMIGFPSRDEIAESCDTEALEYEDKISPALLTPSSQQPTPGPLPAASVASAPVLVATEDGGK